MIVWKSPVLQHSNSKISVLLILVRNYFEIFTTDSSMETEIITLQWKWPASSFFSFQRDNRNFRRSDTVIKIPLIPCLFSVLKHLPVFPMEPYRYHPLNGLSFSLSTSHNVFLCLKFSFSSTKGGSYLMNWCIWYTNILI